MAQLVFSHMALNCKDMATIEQFYTTYFGFKRARAIPLGEGQQIVFIKCGTMYLELFQSEGDSPTAPAPEADGYHFPGWRHLAFQVDDVDAKLAELGEAAKITLRPAGFRALHSWLAHGLGQRPRRQHRRDQPGIYGSR